MEDRAVPAPDAPIIYSKTAIERLTDKSLTEPSEPLLDTLMKPRIAAACILLLATPIIFLIGLAYMGPGKREEEVIFGLIMWSVATLSFFISIFLFLGKKGLKKSLKKPRSQPVVPRTLDPNPFYDPKATPLKTFIESVIRGDFATAQHILDEGQEIDAAFTLGRDGRRIIDLTTLHLAAIESNEDGVAFLLANGADARILMGNGQHCKTVIQSRNIRLMLWRAVTPGRQSVVLTEDPGNSDEINAKIVLGADADAMSAAIREQFEKNGAGIILLTGRRVSDISILASTISPCSLSFTHFIPGQRGRVLGEDDFRAWGEKLMSGASYSPEAFGHPELKWFCDTLGGSVTLDLHWEHVDTTLCLEVAQGLEDSYIRQGGRY